MMDMKEEMMSDTIDDVMDGEEDEEEEGDKILKEVLDEIGVNLSQQVRYILPHLIFAAHAYILAYRRSNWHRRNNFSPCE